MKNNIKNFWWEDSTTFCFETDDGKVYRLTNAHIKDWRFSDENSQETNACEIIELKIKYE